MARTILLVDPDLDALGLQASRLRGLGLTVILADSAVGAVERLRSGRVDAVLISDGLREATSLHHRLSTDPDVLGAPCFLLSDQVGPLDAGSHARALNVLPRHDAGAIAEQLHSIPSRPSTLPALRDDFRGDLQQVSIVDLLQLLSMNRRTGLLGVVTAIGAGEVRLREGEIVDAVYRRLEGEKALFRLLAETDGNFSFASQSVTDTARISTLGPSLLLEGVRQLDEARQIRAHLNLDQDVLVASGVTGFEWSGEADLAHQVGAALAVPRTLDEILDDLAFPDLLILRAIVDLLGAGLIRRVPKDQVRVPLATSERAPVLAALINRLKPHGYSGAARVVIAARARRLRTVVHAVYRLGDACMINESPPTLPAPFPIATVRVGESTELLLVGLPLVEAYIALWALTLPGTSCVVSLEAQLSGPLQSLCAVWGIPVLPASLLMADLDEADPTQLAALLRLALEHTAAG